MQSSQRSTCPPSAAVRQPSIADMAFIWPRLTWPALALRHAAPWARKTSAIPGLRSGDRAMRPRSGGRRSAGEVDAQPLQRARDVADRVDGDAGVERGRARSSPAWRVRAGTRHNALYVTESQSSPERNRLLAGAAAHF